MLDVELRYVRTVEVYSPEGRFLFSADHRRGVGGTREDGPPPRILYHYIIMWWGGNPKHQGPRFPLHRTHKASQEPARLAESLSAGIFR